MTAPGARAARVYVNERGVDAAPGATALDAVRLHDPGEADRVAAGERAITDSRGLPVTPDALVFAGAIYRTVAARRAGATDGAGGGA